MFWRRRFSTLHRYWPSPKRRRFTRRLPQRPMYPRPKRSATRRRGRPCAAVRAKLDSLELVRTQPKESFALTIHPFQNWHVNGAALDETTKFTERPARGERNKPRNALASAFRAESEIMAVCTQLGVVEGKMRRVVALVAARIPETPPVGDCEPFRGVFRSEPIQFAQPRTRRRSGRRRTSCLSPTRAIRLMMTRTSTFCSSGWRLGDVGAWTTRASNAGRAVYERCVAAPSAARDDSTASRTRSADVAASRTRSEDEPCSHVERGKGACARRARRQCSKAVPWCSRVELCHHEHALVPARTRRLRRLRAAGSR